MNMDTYALYLAQPTCTRNMTDFPQGCQGGPDRVCQEGPARGTQGQPGQVNWLNPSPVVGTGTALVHHPPTHLRYIPHRVYCRPVYVRYRVLVVHCTLVNLQVLAPGQQSQAKLESGQARVKPGLESGKARGKPGLESSRD